MYERYARLRDLNGMTDSAVATAIEIGRSTFSDWKSGRSEPKISKLNKIANYFGVSVEYFVSDTPEKYLKGLKPIKKKAKK